MPSNVSFEDAYAQVRAQLGKTRRVPIGTISRRDFQRFAVAADDQNPLFFDDRFAQQHGYPAAIAPPLYPSSVMDWEAGPPEASLRSDGTPAAEPTSLAVEGLRLMGGGQELEFHRPFIDGTEVMMEFGVTQVELKQGRSGPLLVIEVHKNYLDGAGSLLLVCRENFIAR